MEPIIGWVPTTKPGSTGTLTIELPSGNRKLHYHNPRIVPDTQGRDGLVFDGLDDKEQWVPIRTWGAKLTENVVQAIARDIMAEAAVRVEENFDNVGLVLSVHDELVFEINKGLFNTLPAAFKDRVGKVVVERPDWAPTLPVAAGGKIMKRYGK
jgi:DNA polymerase